MLTLRPMFSPSFSGFRRAKRRAEPLPSLPARFGIRDAKQLRCDLTQVAVGLASGRRFQWNLGSVGLLRPDLSLPAYAGLVPTDGQAPIYNLFDRSADETNWYTTRVSRARARDFRGGRLSYDDHRGTDFVCPLGTAIVAAAPGRVVMTRDVWLRGGLTLALDHGDGLLTQYSHLARTLVFVGQRVARGETIGLAGASGYDLVQFFPWVPPHLHFMAWLDGRPADPYGGPGEAALWLDGNAPRPRGPVDDDPDPEELASSDVDEASLERLTAACTDPRLREEIRGYESAASRAAVIEDALHHSAWAWPRPYWNQTVRPSRIDDRDRPLKLSLPLPAEQYAGARFADTRWTDPRRN